MIFDKIWFKSNQKMLLYFLNYSIFKRLFRRALKIKDKNIVNWIIPHAYSTRKGDKCTATFYEDNHFSDALYFGFKPIWFLIHKWDMYIANNIFPQLNLGYDTLTRYTDNPAGSGCDGWTRANIVENTFSVLVNADGTSGSKTTSESAAYLKSSSFTDGRYEQLGRALWSFSTSIIGVNGWWVSAVQLNAYVVRENHQLGAPKIYIVKNNQASNTNIVASDHQRLDRNTVYAGPFFTHNDSSWKDYDLNPNCINAWANTKLGSMVHWDQELSEPGKWANNERSGITYRTTASGSDKPRLIVAYSFTAPPGEQTSQYIMLI